MAALKDYFKQIYGAEGMIGTIHSCPELMTCIQQVGFLPLLESGIKGYAAESMMAVALVAMERFGGARR